MRQDQVAMINAGIRHGFSDGSATSTITRKTAGQRTIPARKQRRKVRRNVHVSNPFARPIRRGPQPPAAIDSLVAIHIKNEDGKVVRRFVIPRDKLQAELLAKPRSAANE